LNPDKSRVSSAPSRALKPDSPRLVALFGIVVIDVRFIAFAAPAGLDEPASETALDLVTARLVNGLRSSRPTGCSRSCTASASGS
jgi:hypothetical protein